jgi:hypothetical protein
LQFESCGWKTAKIHNNQHLNLPFLWLSRWEYGGKGTGVELVVWGEDEQCLAGGGRKISCCMVCRDKRLLKFCRFSTTTIPESYVEQVIKNDPPRIGTSQQAARHKRTTTTAAILH